MKTAAVSKVAGSPNPPTTLTLNSEILGEKRKIYIQLPEGYEQTQRAYPLLCVLDGEWLYEIVRANLRFYSEYGVMGSLYPQTIVVGIENLDRDKDYVPTPDLQDPPRFPTAGRADQFAEFLSAELFPYLAQNYRLAQSRTLVGWSFGGLFALYAALQHQDLFDSFLCIGPAIWWDDELVVKMFNEVPLRKKKRLVITCGSEEKGGPVYDSVQSLLKLIAEEHPRNLISSYIEIDGVGHSWGIPEVVDRGFKSLFKGYLPAQDFKSLKELESYYSDLSQAWGYKVLPPESAMLQLANDLWSADQKAEALEVMAQLLAASPNSSMGYFYQGKFLALLNRTASAIDALQKAINLELARPVPNLVYIRGYQSRLKKVIEPEE